MENQWIKITAPQMVVIIMALILVLCLGSCFLCGGIPFLAELAGADFSLTPVP